MTVLVTVPAMILAEALVTYMFFYAPNRESCPDIILCWPRLALGIHFHGEWDSD